MLNIQIIDTVSGYTETEEKEKDKQVEICDQFRKFIKEKKKYFESRFQEFKRDRYDNKVFKEYHKKMVMDVFVNVEVPVWLDNHSIIANEVRRAYTRFAVSVLSFKERKYQRYLL